MSDTKAESVIGRPSTFTPEIAETICRRIVEGESLRSICEEVGMPSKSTVLLWAQNDRTFSDQYARARELAGESDADDVAHYSRQAAKGEIEPAAATAAINGLKWSAGKRNAKKYGDATQVKHSGAIGTFDASKHTDEELAVLAAVLGPAAISGRDAESGEGGDSEALG